MVDLPELRNTADLAAIEARGIEAFLPAPTPYSIIERSAATWPQNTAIQYLSRIGQPELNRIISYSDLLASVRQAANLFHRLNVEPEESVAILTPHIPQGQIALWAAEVAGRACPLNPMLRPDHLLSLLRAARAKVAVVLGTNSELDIWNHVIKPLRTSGCVQTVLHTDSEGSSPESDGSFDDLIRNEPKDHLTFSPNPGPNAIAAYFHTGGTTGAPKLAQHTRRNEAFIAAAAALMYRLRPNDVLVNGYPIFHVAGSFCYGLSVLSAGAALLIPTRLGMRTKQFISKIWKHVEQYRITVIGGVPTVVSALNMVPIDADISTLRLVISGGSPLPTELADALERLVGKPLLRNLFGMTECAGVVTLEPFSDARSPGSAGFRLPFTEVRAFRDVGGKVDLDAPCDVDETGVLALRGPHVAPGYTEEKMNAGTFERGWLISGDLGHVGTNERVYVTGRAKDVIIRGAHNIDPSMIEDAMLQHPDVAVAGAVGQPDSYAGEIPVVFVSLKPGSTVTEDQLREFVGPLVAEPAAQPKHVWILPELPMTPIGKIYKPTLREIATKRAMTDSLLRAGVPPSLFEIEMHQRKGVVRLKSKDRKHTAQAQQALLGMPVEYEIQEIPKAESVK